MFIFPIQKNEKDLNIHVYIVDIPFFMWSAAMSCRDYSTYLRYESRQMIEICKHVF